VNRTVNLNVIVTIITEQSRIIYEVDRIQTSPLPEIHINIYIYIYMIKFCYIIYKKNHCDQSFMQFNVLCIEILGFPEIKAC
jgi:hypothetical protein